MHRKFNRRAAFALGAGLFASIAGAVEVGRDWQIVYPDAGEAVVRGSLRAAAEEISRDIAEATGFTLPVVPASQAKSPAIRLGETAAAAAGLMPADMRAFQNVIAEKGGDIFLFGRDKPGRKGLREHDWMVSAVPSARAAARFLKSHVGVRFLMPGVTGTEVTFRGPVTVPDGTFDRETPNFDYGAGRYHGMMYDMGNNIFGLSTVHTYGGHSYEPACPASLGKEHPEYFGLFGGKRVVAPHGAALCVSNPAVQQLMVDELCRRFDAGADVCQLGQQDGFRGCECEKCAAIGGGGLDWGERLWIVHRDVAARLAKLRPGKIVHIMCYGPTAMPPKTFKVFPENVMIELCSYSEASFRRWEGYTVPNGFTVYTYLWGDYPRTGFTPKRSFAHVAMMARRFVRHHVRGIYRCGFGELFGMEGPFYYVFNSLLENPDADVTALVAEYCQAAFGPAAPQMLAFYDRLNLQLQASSLVDEGWSDAVGGGLGDYRRTYAGSSLPMLAYIYSPDAVKALESSLVRAEKTAGLSEKVRRRLALVRLEWTYARNLGKIGNLFAAYKFTPSAGTFAPLADAVRERNAFLDWLYEKSASSPRKIEGWPDYNVFGGFDRKMVSTNGRLGATLSAPLNWDVDFLTKAGVLPGAGVKSMKAVRAAARPSADDFEAGEWRKAAWQDLAGSQMQTLAQDRRARVKVLYDDEAVCFALESDLDDALVLKDFARDGAVWTDECVEVLVDPFGSRDVYFHLIAGAKAGVVYDEAVGLIADPLNPKFRKPDSDWNAKGVETSSRRANGRWAIMIRLPYADMGAKAPAPGDVWGVNFCRTWDFNKGGEKTTSAFWNPNLESGGFDAPEAMGGLSFE